MTNLDLGALRRAVTSLGDALDIVGQDWFAAQPEKVQNTLVAGVVQNFEFTYEICVKMMKRQIEAESASPEDVDQSNFRDVLRAAAEKGLMADVEAWFGYRAMRNITAHTYDVDKARQICEGAKVFVGDARFLLVKLEARNG